LASLVAVTCERGVAMLAVAVQVPTVVLKPVATAGSATANDAQMAGATDLIWNENGKEPPRLPLRNP
jgi:hypothetical protein